MDFVPFTSAITEYPKKPGKVLARDYRPHGRIPIVDQGQAFIAGWTDDETLALSEGLPVVVFGDHTRTFKYVDFPFALGADGTQLLKPGAEFDARFFYYACLSIALPSRGYNRHFTLLKEQSLPKPSLRDQKKIATALRTIERGLETEDKLIETARELKSALLFELLTRGLGDEDARETDIGPLPGSWRVVPLGTLGRIGNGSTPLVKNTAYWNGTIPWLTSAKVYDVTIKQAERFVTPLAVEECHLPRVRPGSVLIAITGQGKTLGHAAVTDIETCVSQHIAYVQFQDADINPHFIRLFLESRYQELRAVAQGGGSTKGALTCGFLKSFRVPLPGRLEQDEIASRVMAIEEAVSVHERKRGALEEVFKKLLHDLMTGEVGVEELDLPTAEVSAA